MTLPACLRDDPRDNPGDPDCKCCGGSGGDWEHPCPVCRYSGIDPAYSRRMNEDREPIEDDFEETWP